MAESKKKSAVQSFKGWINSVMEPLEAVHSTSQKRKKTGKNFSVLHKNQAEYLGMMSWMMGSIEKPCISQRNCSEVIDRSSSDDLGHEKCPHSTLL